jgi:hypothetical protein
MNFLVPQGIGDSIWALLKIQDISKKIGDGVINVFIACQDSNNSSEARSLEFIRRFHFVYKCEMYQMPMEGRQGCVLLPGAASDDNGLYRYIDNGKTTLPGIDYILIPNYTLERGIRIEDWLPDYAINWNVMDRFKFEESSFNKQYVIFFLGSIAGNTTSGHNRNSIWTPQQWVELGRRIQKEFGCYIFVVGADYDMSYYTDYIEPLLNKNDNWFNFIDMFNIGQTFAMVKNARFVISYQSGIGIVANYMNVPTAMFWRAKGDSISPNSYISFEEDMAKAWTKPGVNYLPLIYGKHDVDYIINEIQKW